MSRIAYLWVELVNVITFVAEVEELEKIRKSFMNL